MVLNFLRSNSTPISIDFGYAELKVLQIAAGDPGQVMSAATASIPDEARRDPVLRQQFVSEALPQLLRDGRFKGKTAICSIPAWQTVCQHLQVTRSDKGDIADSVMNELQMRTGCDPSQVVVRHEQVCDIVRDGKPLTEVICFAVAREYVMKQVELLERCKLVVAGLLSEPLAVVHACADLGPEDRDHRITSLILDFGSNGTKVMISHGASLRFAKSIPVGGRHFDLEIAEALDCDAECAHMHRMTALCGSTQPVPSLLGSTGPATLAASPSADGEEVVDPVMQMRGVMSRMAEQLVEEVGMCMRYHLDLFPDRPVDRVIMVGGESRNVAFCEEVAEALGVPAFVGDPLTRLSLAEECTLIGLEDTGEQPGWVVPYGLCSCPTDL